MLLSEANLLELALTPCSWISLILVNYSWLKFYFVFSFEFLFISEKCRYRFRTVKMYLKRTHAVLIHVSGSQKKCIHKIPNKKNSLLCQSIDLTLLPLKGTVSRDFRPSGFFIKQSFLRPWFMGLRRDFFRSLPLVRAFNFYFQNVSVFMQIIYIFTNILIASEKRWTHKQVLRAEK
jgi:hypothetical protein